MASLNGETLPTKVVAIEPILGSIKYEARSHYHSVFRGDCIHSRVQQSSVKSSFISVRGLHDESLGVQAYCWSPRPTQEG